MDDTLAPPGARATGPASPLTASTTTRSGCSASASGAPHAAIAARLLDGALRCAEECHWDVFPGTWLTDVRGTPRCSCGDRACAAPGAHPSGPEWSGVATGSAVTVRRLWADQPLASVLLPTGRTFDAIDVPEAAGCLALARLERTGVPLGPVLASPARRLLFLVLPGAVLKVTVRLRRQGRAPGLPGLGVRADGDYVVAPPTRVGTSGQARWVREPTPANRWLPDADTLLSALTYAVTSALPTPPPSAPPR